MSNQSLRLRLAIGAMGGAGSGRLPVTIVDLTIDGTEVHSRILSAIELPEPSFLAVLPCGDDALAAVSEITAGAVLLLDVRNGSVLSDRPHAVAVGSSPCHLAVSPDGRFIAVAEYAAGGLSVIRMDRHAGVPVVHRLALPPGRGAVGGRQDGPHAHFTHWMGSSRLLLTDLGCDRVVDVAVSASGETAIMSVCRLPAGSGPRHVGVSRGSVLVVGELDQRLHVLDADTLGYRGSVPLSHSPSSADHLPSHVAVSRDGTRAYVAMRGRDTISVLALGEAEPQLVAETSAGGAWPRHFLLTDAHLLVANQHSDAVAILPLRDGIPGERIGSLRHPRPSCVVSMATSDH